MTIEEEIAQLREANEKLKASIKEEQDQLKPNQKWQAVITDAKGITQTKIDSKGKVIELAKMFATSGEADKWIIQRLSVDGQPGWQAILQHMLSGVREIVTRDQALGRAVGHKQRTVTHAAAGYRLGGKLEFGVKVKETRVEFSRG
jgi:hypothetical protein